MATGGIPVASALMPFDDRSVSGRAIRERRSIVADEPRAEHEAKYPASVMHKIGFQAEVVVPLLHRDAVLGTLLVYRRERLPFDGRHVELLESFADQAVIAIETARLFEELQTRVGELQALGEVGQAVSSSLDLQEVLTTIVAHATRLAQADGGTIFELDEAAGEFVHRASYRLPDELLATIDRNRPRLDSDTAAGRAARSGAAVQVPDIAKAEDAAMPGTLDVLRSAGFRSLIFVPLVRSSGPSACS